MTGGGDSYYPMRRTQRAVDDFVLTGNTAVGETVLLTICPQAGSNPNREGAGAVAAAIPVVGCRAIVAVYIASAADLFYVSGAFVGGGAPAWRNLYVSAAMTGGRLLQTFDLPIIPAVRFSLFAAAIVAYEVAVTVISSA